MLQSMRCCQWPYTITVHPESIERYGPSGWLRALPPPRGAPCQPAPMLTSTKPLPIWSSSRKDWSLWSTVPASTLPAQLEQAPARQL